jgi:hypothetical protein
MRTNALHRDRSSGKAYRLESRAFYLGEHDIDPEPVMQEIEAKMVQESAEEREQLLRRPRERASKCALIRVHSHSRSLCALEEVSTSVSHL